VGQKTHPTGFRIGVNKTHSSTWFANYGAYSEVLKEDYKIRTFFEKEFEAIYSKAGITKLEILRKVNQVELVVHAARPKAIAGDNEQSSIINSFRDSLKALVGNTKQIRIKVCQITKSENESLLVARSIGDQLEKRVAFRKAIRQTTQMLQKKWRERV
jgi:small subunit ribosomal protein S3